MIKLEEMSSEDLVAYLKATPVQEWNIEYAKARKRNCGWRANLRFANLRSADLRFADLGYADLRFANLRSADLRFADLGYADLGYADLGYADLGSANLRSHKLTGQHLQIGPVAGYQVNIFASDQGHVMRAGCWTGQLSEMIQRAQQEEMNGKRMDEVVRLELYLTDVIRGWSSKGRAQDACSVKGEAGSAISIDVERSLVNQGESIADHEGRIRSLEDSRDALGRAIGGKDA